MLIRNKDMIQSYVLTAAKYDFSVHEKRILYRLVELCQYMIEGKTLDASYSIDKNLMGDRVVTMPIRYLLKDETDHNYEKVKAALRSLRNKTIEYQDEKSWKVIGFIEKPKIENYATAVKFELQEEIYECLFNFAKGFRKYELKVAMDFESAYSMRFYELFSGQKSPIEYSIEHLKAIFKIEDKYKGKPTDFINKVIEPARRELTEKAPYSFKFTPLKKDGSRSYVSIKFYPYYIPENRDPILESIELNKKSSIRWDLSIPEINYLRENFGFSDDEIKNNQQLFAAASERLDLLLKLSELKGRMGSVRNAQGYVVNALKKMLNGKNA